MLKAYRAARDRISVDRLVAILKQLAYVYPYHQPIGFLMQRAGYPEPGIDQLRALGLNHDFYLAHGLQQPEYSKELRYSIQGHWIASVARMSAATPGADMRELSRMSLRSSGPQTSS